MDNLNEIKVGDTIVIECDSGLGSGGASKVTKITTQYNGISGRLYNVIWCGNHKFSAKNGRALNPPIAYYISRIVK